MAARFHRGRFVVDARMKSGLEELPFEVLPPPPGAAVFLCQHLARPGNLWCGKGRRWRMRTIPSPCPSTAGDGHSRWG